MENTIIISSLNEIISKIQKMEDKINKLDEQMKMLLDENIKKCLYCNKFNILNDCIECHICKEKICNKCIIEYEYDSYHKLYVEKYCPKCINLKYKI